MKEIIAVWPAIEIHLTFTGECYLSQNLASSCLSQTGKVRESQRVPSGSELLDLNSYKTAQTKSDTTLPQKRKGSVFLSLYLFHSFIVYFSLCLNVLGELPQ